MVNKKYISRGENESKYTVLMTMDEFKNEYGEIDD